MCIFGSNNFSIFVAKFGDLSGKNWQILGFQMAIFHDASSLGFFFNQYLLFFIVFT